MFNKLNGDLGRILEQIGSLGLATETQKQTIQELTKNRWFATKVMDSLELVTERIDLRVMFRLFFGDFMLLNVSQIDQGLLEDTSDMLHDNPSHVHEALRELIHMRGELCHEHRDKLFYQGYANEMREKSFAKKLEVMS